MRGAVCVQSGLDVGISELVVGAIVREFVVWRGQSRFRPRSPPTLSSRAERRTCFLRALRRTSAECADKKIKRLARRAASHARG
jgi:hypothetical protein